VNKTLAAAILRKRKKILQEEAGEEYARRRILVGAYTSISSRHQSPSKVHVVSELSILTYYIYLLICLHYTDPKI
jgi:hypothetical protein